MLQWDDRPQPTAREMLDSFARTICWFLAIWGTVAVTAILLGK